MHSLQETPRFNRFQQLLPRVYINVVPKGFSVKGGPVYQAGQNDSSFLILALACMADWQVWRAELYFAERARHVKATPFGHDFPELRALLRHDELKPVSEVVKFF